MTPCATGSRTWTPRTICWVRSQDHTRSPYREGFPLRHRDRGQGTNAGAHGTLPDAVTACIGGGSNAMGIFHAFLDDENVRLVGYEAGGDGVDTPHHAATLVQGRAGVLHGARSLVLQDEDGQTIESHSISAGLDYPGVGPEHAWLQSIGRTEYQAVTDDEAMQAMRRLSQTEGIIPAIETAHGLAGTEKLGRELGPEAHILVNLSGRGDKDMETAARYFGLIGSDQSA
jgi:Tryptophan synthase beta chain